MPGNQVQSESGGHRHVVPAVDVVSVLRTVRVMTARATESRHRHLLSIDSTCLFE